MAFMDFAKRELDLVLTLIIFFLIIIIKFYLKIEYSSIISTDVFLQIYAAIIAVVLTVFAIITSLPERLFVNVIKKRFYGIFRRSFYTPFIASVIGIIYTIFITFKTHELVTEIKYTLNFAILLYAVLSSLVLFNFIFKLTFELKKELYKK